MGAEEDVLEVLLSSVPREHRVLMHSYQGSVEIMNKFLELWPNGCVGINGAITYDGCDEPGGLHDVVRELPLNRTVLETDGPYMAPYPYRGQESHPGHIPWIAEALSRIKGNAGGTAEVLSLTDQ